MTWIPEAPVLPQEQEDKRLIQNAYRKLLRSVHSELDNADRKLIRAAYELAVDAHKTQRRKSGEPYILHPIAVATICAKEIGLGPTAIAAALLRRGRRYFGDAGSPPAPIWGAGDEYRRWFD